ncbi:MAG: hypothetical protein IT348_04250 [Candidatus Eisenbacteria bacterium]|nr:hypothetical protein [Candidatus Eisenbacteria bacterium]
MQGRARLRQGVLLFVVSLIVLGAGSCRSYVTRSIYRSPVISEVLAFPTTLGAAESTMITVFATDPDGDSLVYDWSAYNGLVMKGHPGQHDVYGTRSSSMVFYSPVSWSYDTAFVWCGVRDERGGSDSRQVTILFHH